MTPAPDIVEKVARANYEARIIRQFGSPAGTAFHPRRGLKTVAWDDLPLGLREQETDTARELMGAHLAALEEAGMVVISKEGLYRLFDEVGIEFVAEHEAMLAARPKD